MKNTRHKTRTFLGSVVAAMTVGASSVFGASILTNVDITAQVLTSGWSSHFYEYDGNAAEGVGETLYYEAIQDCELWWDYDDSKILGNQSCVYWSEFTERYEAVRTDSITDIPVYLSNVSKTQYCEVYLKCEIEIEEPLFLHGWTNVWWIEELEVGVDVTVEKTFSDRWQTWEEWLDDDRGFYAISDDELKIWGVMQIKDVQPERINPDPKRACKGDPINTVNGNVNHAETDIFVPCPGIPLQFKRFYNSVLDYDGPLGHRWTHSLNWFLFTSNSVFQSTTNSWQLLQTGEGRQFWFAEATNNTFEAPFDNSWTLALTNNKYKATLPGEMTYTFSSNGVLESMSDGWQNDLTFSYTNDYPNNLLKRVEHNNGQYLDFSYDGSRIVQIATPSTNFGMSFSYNGQGELTNATRTVSTGTFVTDYAYDAATNFWNHSLTQRVNAAGDVYAWEYATNASGEATSEGIRTVVASTYFDTYFNQSATLNQTALTIARGDTNLLFTYHYNPILKRIDKIAGPILNATNWFGRGKEVHFTHDDYGNVTSEKTYDSQTLEWMKTVKEYDSCHNVTNEGFSYGCEPSNIWVYTWNTNGQLLTSSTDPEGRKVEFEYTKALPSRIKTFYNASNSYDSSFGYTTNGLIAAVTNANGHWVRYEYDSYGFPTQTVPQVGPVTILDYSQLGHLEKITLPTGTSTTSGVPIYRETSFQNNELGQVLKITYPDSLYDSFSYDPIGNMTNHVDTVGRSTRYAYLPTRKLSSVTRTLTGATNQDITVSVDYDNQFNSLKFTDAKNRAVETYELDAQDRLVTVTNLEGQTMSIKYGVSEFVRSVTRFDDTVVSNEFDGDGRLHKVHYPDNTATFTYFKNDLLKTAANDEGTVTLSYNGANRLTGDVGVMTNGTVSYTYFPSGQASNVTSVAGTTTHSLDGADRIEKITAPEGVFEYTYNTNNGLVAEVVCTNTGVKQALTYDSRDRVTGMSWKNSSDETIKSFVYEFDDAGMIADIVYETGEEVEYGYDSLDRLTSEKRYTALGTLFTDQGYSYDEVGNRTEKTRDDLTVSYTCATNGNRLASWSIQETNLLAYAYVAGNSSEAIGTDDRFGYLWVSNTAAMTPFVEGTNFWAFSVPIYLGTQEVAAAVRDAAGNTVYVTNSVVMSVVTNGQYLYSDAGCVTNIDYSGVGYSRSVSLEWNGKYQLTSVSTNGTLAEKYGYGPLGRRVYISDGATTNWLVYSGPHLVAEVDGSGNLLRSYSTGPGIDNLLAMTVHGASSTNTYFYLTDHLGSVHAIVDESGDVVETMRYDAWGRTSVYDAEGNELSESAIGNRFGFQGREISWRTRLMYFRARYYDCYTGRWLSKDPIGISGGLNQYVFCENNPVNFVDPFGLKTYLYLIGQDGNKLPLDKAAKYLSGQLSLGADDKVVIQHISGFKDFNQALQSNKDIAQINYIGHGGPGILFLGMGTDSDTNITGAGGKHGIGDVYFESCSVKDLDKSNVRSDAEINLYSCFSGRQGWDYGSIARSFGQHFGVPTYGAWFGTKFKSNGQPYTFGGYLKQ